MFEKYYKSLYKNINPSEQLIEETKVKMEINLINKKILISPVFKICASICILLICSGGITAFAYHLTGGDFFRAFFAERINNNAEIEDSSVDLNQIDYMTSNTIGTVVDTDEITIDIMGVIVSKNTASIMLRVTANQLNSVLIEGDSGGLRHYRFEDNTFGNLFDDCKSITYQYFYSNEKDGLEENQLEILYTIIKNEDLQGKQYEIGLSKFGSYNNTNSYMKTITAIYYDTWKFTIDFTSESDNNSTVYINKPVIDHDIIINNFSITPLALTIDFTGTALNEDVFRQEFAYLCDNIKLEIHFRDGGLLKAKDFYDYSFRSSFDINKYDITIIFNAPVNIQEVLSIRLFENNYMIQ